MFVSGELRYTFFSFVLDNYCLGLSKNINRCKSLCKNTMSNIEDSVPSDINYTEDTDKKTAQASSDLPTSNLNDNNIRRAWSVESLSNFGSSTRRFTRWGEPVFYWNLSSVAPAQRWDYYWINNSTCLVPNPCAINSGNFSERCATIVQSNNRIIGLIPPPPPPPISLLSSQSVDNIQMTRKRGANYLLPNPCAINNHENFSGGFESAVQNNNPFLGLIPQRPRSPNPLLLSRSIESVQTMSTRGYCIRRNNSEDNLQRRTALNPKVLKVLSKRYWEDVGDKKKSSKPGVEFTLMSYNVLAQDLIKDHTYLYKQHNPRALQWERRWRNIFEEISKFMPDIVCLQEVQESHLIFYSRLESLGYKSIYKKRTGIRCDGCAIYYKTNKFNLLEYETVELFQPNVDILNRDNIAIIAKFSPVVSPRSEFVVATTHLLYNPKRQDVRLAQTQLLLTEVERMSFNGKDPSYWPIIVTGDFNSPPDSAVYELITKGFLRYDHLSARKLNVAESPCQGRVLVPSNLEITDRCQHASLVQQRQKMENVSRQEEAALIKLHNSDKTVLKVTTQSIENSSLFCSGTLSHLFALKSVYNHGDPNNTEGSTFQDKWLTVDYIFYSGKKRNEDIKDHRLKLLSRYRLPRKSELGSIKIPNCALGSDHLSLVAKFKLKI